MASVLTRLADDKDKEKTETPAETKTEEKTVDPAKTEEKTVDPTKTEEKKSKRGSIFGKMGGAFGSMKSPTKEKEQKDAELKPEVPPKDAPISANPPVLPGTSSTAPVLPVTATTEPSNPELEAREIEAVAEAEVIEERNAKLKESNEATAATASATTPSKEKSGFLSSFMKRTRSVSPSTAMKDQPAKTETETPKTETTEATEPVKTEEPTKTEEAVAETVATEPVADKSTEKTEEPTAAATTTTEASTPNKRESMLGSLGRRASKAMNSMRPQKKENTSPTTATESGATEATPVDDKPTINGETKTPEPQQEQQTIGDVVPDAIVAGETQKANPPVAASA